MKPEEEWEWDTASDLIKDKAFELSGPNSIATKIDQNLDWDNCMVVERVLGAGTGKLTISMKLSKGDEDHMLIFCSVVRDGSCAVPMGVFVKTANFGAIRLEGSSFFWF